MKQILNIFLPVMAMLVAAVLILSNYMEWLTLSDGCVLLSTILLLALIAWQFQKTRSKAA